MKTSITTSALKPVLIAALGLLLLSVFAQPALASKQNIGHANATQLLRGQLGPNNPQDGRWFFVSGQRSSLEVTALSKSGVSIESMAIYSYTPSRWLSTTRNRTLHTFTGQVGSGWYYALLEDFSGATIP